MLQKALTVVFGSKHERDIKKIQPLVDQISALEPEMQKLSDEDLGQLTPSLKARLVAGEALDHILPEAFAAVREAGWRALGLRLYDVQLIGGIVLHQGKIAEMKTGEGKTLTSTTAIYLNSLAGKGVHVVTVNDYLAKRDAAWMKPIYDLLGVTVGAIQHDLDYDDRQAAYAADITYGTNNEFGFDYLRDNMVTELEFRTQRGHFFGIVDEVDSILIDEARTPLIISGPTEENIDIYKEVDKTVRRLIEAEGKAPPPPPRYVEPGKEEPNLIPGFYFDKDEKARNVMLTEVGIHEVEQYVEVENLFAPENVELVATINQSLRAHIIYKDEVDYIVRDGEVIIIDEFTGRTMEGRRYSDGLHQAIEAKERVEVKQETQTLASITFQNYFRLYKKLAGMTGTADTEAEEFKKIYQLEVVVIPTNVPVIRHDHADRVYRTEREKYAAIVEELRERQTAGQPVLVGTVSVEKSEHLSGLLRKAGIAHSVLNAKQHAKEAEIVANAGTTGTVTVATNMAGRGTDIVLGGTPLYAKDLEEFEETEEAVRRFKTALLKKRFSEAREISGEIQSGARQKIAREILDRAEIWLANHRKVKEAGGLHILGTERHEARRIDNQLRGRSGRQGDPGSSRFYLSLEDPLMRIFGGQRMMNIMERLGMTEGQELEAGMVDRAIARAQKRVESHNFDIRKHLLEYDDVMNKQREYVYTERNLILENDSVRDHMRGWAEDVIEEQIIAYCEGEDPARWDLDSLREWMGQILDIDLDVKQEEFRRTANPQLALFNKVWEECKRTYDGRISAVGADNFNYVERRIGLDVIDARWKEHLHVVDQLREGIWSQSYAEKNPLVEYKFEAFRLFDEMTHAVKAQVTEFLFRVQIEGDLGNLGPARRAQGEAQHQEFGSSFSGNGDGSPFGPAGFGNARPISNQRKTQTSSSSGGGASKRKKSRRRRK